MFTLGANAVPIFFGGGGGGGGNNKPKCRYVAQTAYFPTYDTVYKQVKKYFENVKKIINSKLFKECSTSYEEQCSTSYETEYQTTYEQECTTEYETKCEQTYKTEYKEECSTSYEQECSTSYETTYEQQCSTSYETVCEEAQSSYGGSSGGYGAPSAPKCSQVPKQNCQQVMLRDREIGKLI